MIQDFSLHTHTIGFDGRNTPADMVERAKSLGFRSLGISNHFIVHPNITQGRFYPFAVSGGYSSIYSTSFDEAINRFIPHYEELIKLADTCDIKLYRGMEVDFFDTPDWMRGFERARKILQPDYVIGSSHFIEHDGRLCNVHDMVNADAETRNKMLTQYWTKVGRAADTGLFNWMAHLDLPKKVGAGRENQWISIEYDTVKKIAATKTPIEINTSLYRPNCDEPYPSPRILKMAAAENIPVLISDDAHRVRNIGEHFGLAYSLAKQCGITRFLTCNAVIGKTY